MAYMWSVILPRYLNYSEKKERASDHLLKKNEERNARGFAKKKTKGLQRWESPMEAQEGEQIHGVVFLKAEWQKGLQNSSVVVEGCIFYSSIFWRIY